MFGRAVQLFANALLSTFLMSFDESLTTFQQLIHSTQIILNADLTKNMSRIHIITIASGFCSGLLSRVNLKLHECKL